jgi:IS605 OrfB family transposase
MTITTVTTIHLRCVPRGADDARREAARLWNRMVILHHWFRKRRKLWPSEAQFKAHFKRRLTKAIRKAGRRRENIQRNFLHHAANSVSKFCQERSVGTLFVGDVTEMNRNKRGSRSKRLHQEVGNIPWGQFISYLDYKLAQVGCKISVTTERYTTQTCPACGERRKVAGRNYSCRACGFSAARDQVGTWNILNQGVNEFIQPGAFVPTSKPTYRRPVKMRASKRNVVDLMTSGKLRATTPVADGVNASSRDRKIARSAA